MKMLNRLAFKLPVAVGLAVLLGGCYTMLKHPSTDLTTRHETDYRTSDCASCHQQGFSQPLVPDPYGYANSWFWGYYGCPWWLPDCGLGYGAVPGGRTLVPGDVERDDGRHVGGRGMVRGGTGVPSRLPTVGPAPGSGAASPSPSVGPRGEPSSGTSGHGQQRGRTMKQGKGSSSSGASSPPHGKAPGKRPGKPDKPKDKDR